MRKRFYAALIITLMCVFSCTQNKTVYYVRADGNDDNDGLSEKKPLKTLSYAIRWAMSEDTINRLTVIGTLDINSEILFEEVEGEEKQAVFHLFQVLPEREIIISGKPGAEGAERAVLSAAGSQKGVALVMGGGPIRFEHIEISGGEGDYGFGVTLVIGGRIILGPGTVIQDNNRAGVELILGTCIIDGGEVRNNRGPGIVAINKSGLTMQDGIISGNLYDYGGGGVLLESGGSFTMSGGSISGNKAAYGGGVFLNEEDCVFTMSGGSIIGNKAIYGGGVYVGENCLFTLTGGSITDNDASETGGGIAVNTDTGGKLEQTGGDVSGNTAPYSPDIYQDEE